MTTRYVKGTGSNTPPYDSWTAGANAFSTVTALMAAGDITYVSNTSPPTTVTASGTTTYTFANTASNAGRVLCGDDSADPPTAEAQATLTHASAAANQTTNFLGSVVVRKLKFVQTSNAGWDCVMQCLPGNAALNYQMWESCTFDLGGSGLSGSCTVNLLSSYEGSTATHARVNLEWRNTSIKMGGASTSYIHIGGGTFVWHGGSLLSGSNLATNLFKEFDSIGGSGQRVGTNIRIIDVDLSVYTGASKNLILLSGNGPFQWTFDNCKLGSTLAILNGTIDHKGTEVRLRNCDSGATNYRNEYYCYGGSSVTVIDNYLTTGGARAEKADGTAATVPISWKIVTLATGPSFYSPFESDPIAKFNTAIGSSKTITVEGLINTTLPNNDEVWMEVSYMSTVGSPVSALDESSRFASISGSAAALAAGAGDGAWTTTLGSPKSFKITATITPQQVGYILVRINVGKTSSTVYINPDFTIT